MPAHICTCCVHDFLSTRSSNRLVCQNSGNIDVHSQCYEDSRWLPRLQASPTSTWRVPGSRLQIMRINCGAMTKAWHPEDTQGMIRSDFEINEVHLIDVQANTKTCLSLRPTWQMLQKARKGMDDSIDGGTFPPRHRSHALRTPKKSDGTLRPSTASGHLRSKHSFLVFSLDSD
jgi:hypothetical protein